MLVFVEDNLLDLRLGHRLGLASSGVPTLLAMHAVATLDTGALRAVLRLFVLMHLLYLVLYLLDAHLVLGRLSVYSPLVRVVQKELLLVEY